MQYNPYFPATYQPIPNIQPVQTQPQQQSGIIWVQGENGAKSYMVAPGATVMLMDSEAERFYIKTADASGMPLPIRTFTFKEVPQSGSVSDFKAHQDQGSSYVTHDEFDSLKRIVEALRGLQEVKDESAV